MNDPDDYLRLAANLVEHRTFGSGHTAHGLPSAAVSAGAEPVVCRSAITSRNWLAIALLHVVLGVATVGLVCCWGDGGDWDAGGAAVAALLVACDPILLASSSLVMTETLATFLTTAGLLTLTWAGQRRTTT